MSLRTCVLLILLTATVCVVVAVPVALAAERFPNLIGPIVLIGVLVPGVFFGVLGARVLVRDRKAAFAARVRLSSRTICLATGLFFLGLLLSNFTTGILRILGALLAGVGACITLWTVSRAVPEKPSNGSEQPGSPDGFASGTRSDQRNSSVD